MRTLSSLASAATPFGVQLLHARQLALGFARLGVRLRQHRARVAQLEVAALGIDLDHHVVRSGRDAFVAHQLGDLSAHLRGDAGGVRRAQLPGRFDAIFDAHRLDRRRPAPATRSGAAVSVFAPQPASHVAAASVIAARVQKLRILMTVSPRGPGRDRRRE